MVMTKAMKRFLLTLFVCCVGAASASAQASQAESPAETRAKEFTRLLNAGDRAAPAKYAKDNFAPGFLAIPMERHVDFLSSVYDFTRGVEFHSIQEAKPNEVTALLRSKLTGQWLALVVRVEPEAP